MSDTTLIWIQLIIALLILIFLAKWLMKLTKNSTVAALILAVFFLIWTDAGGLAQAEKIGTWEFIRKLIMDMIVFGFFWFLASFFVQPFEKIKTIKKEKDNDK